MIQLTRDQWQALTSNGWPPEIADPNTGETFVLIHKDLFQRMRAILEQEDEIAEIEEMYPVTSEVLDDESSTSRESA